MVDLAELSTLQQEASGLASNLGLVVKELTETELTKFGRCFERSFILHYPDREIADLYNRRIAEALLGAMVAKAQMDGEIDGELPASGKVGGPIEIRAIFAGIGDDWEDGGYNGITTGTAQNWVHSGTTVLGGTSGNAVRVGENAVHVIFGVASRHPSPKLEAVQFTIDGKLKPSITLGWATKQGNGGLKIKEFSDCIVLKKGSTLLAQIFASAIYGTTVVDFPVLLGVSFIKEAQLRVFDPASVHGTTQDVVRTT